MFSCPIAFYQSTISSGSGSSTDLNYCQLSFSTYSYTVVSTMSFCPADFTGVNKR